jgi:NhaP-type Na+/H+ or K+/H+ antiporter
VSLPALLTTAAYSLPLRAFRANLGPISLLAVGLVLITMAVVTAAANALFGRPRSRGASGFPNASW